MCAYPVAKLLMGMEPVGLFVYVVPFLISTVAGSILEKHGHSHNDHFKDVSPETNWISALEHGEKIGIGTMDYELEKL